MNLKICKLGLEYDKVQRCKAENIFCAHCVCVGIFEGDHSCMDCVLLEIEI